MKQCVILSLCAVALAAMGMTAAQADVNVALNLRYNHPGDPSVGGTWTLVATTDDPNSTGITALSVRLLDMPQAGVVDPNIGHDINGGDLVIGLFNTDQTEFVYGQDPNDGLVGNVGLAGSPSNQGADPLGNSVWNNASVIATGTIADLTARPTFVSAAGNQSMTNGDIVGFTADLMNVRGDSYEGLGLESPAGAGLLGGDGNRNGVVGIAEWTAAGVALNDTGAGTWENGDINNSGTVGIAEWTEAGVNLNATTYIPPAIGAVPEPTTLALFGLGLLGFASQRRHFK